MGIGFHTLAYTAALGVNAVDSPVLAVPDDEFSQRNSHYILSEDYWLGWAHYVALSALRARLNIPTINAIARHQIWPIPRSATVEDNPRVADYRDYPIDLPRNEEIAIEASNNLGAATEISTMAIWIIPQGWNRNIPRGTQRLTIRATGSLAGVAQLWSGLGNLTFAENLRGGWYSIVGVQMFCANALLGRLVFPRGPFGSGGRKFRPGFLATNAIGNMPWAPQMGQVGEYGRFHTFEPPQFQQFSIATGASVQEFWLDCVYLGPGDANSMPMMGGS